MLKEITYAEAFALMRKKLRLSQVQMGIALRPEKPLHFRTIYQWENDKAEIPHWAFARAEQLIKEQACLIYGEK